MQTAPAIWHSSMKSGHRCYVFGAYKGLAALAKRRDDTEKADHWAELAERMRQAVEDKFWMEDKSFYAIALDGAGEQCAVRASNTAHLLFVGLPTPERAKLVIEQLFAGRFHSGWGIRTLADDELPFNPMSYHNGSIWPHDTALCAAGLSRYNEREGVVKLASDTFEAAVQFQMRLPELFCGFARLPGEAPVAYPVACLPQAWSAGAPYLLLQACLGLQIDGWRGEVSVERPRLPIGIDRLTISHLRVGSEIVDLHFQRVGRRVACYLDERHDGLASLVVRS
jgi:glycogen debranching enzyme